MFSRSGFTSGYPDGKLGREMFGTRTKEDVTNATPAVLARLHGLTREEYPRVPVVFSLEIAAGKPVSLSVRDEEGYEARAVSEVFPEPARTRPLDEECCSAVLSACSAARAAAAVRSQKCPVVFIIFRQKLRCIQPVRTFLHTLPAVETPFYFLHLLLPLF